MAKVAESHLVSTGPVRIVSSVGNIQSLALTERVYRNVEADRTVTTAMIFGPDGQLVDVHKVIEEKNAA